MLLLLLLMQYEGLLAWVHVEYESHAKFFILSLSLCSFRSSCVCHSFSHVLLLTLSALLFSPVPLLSYSVLLSLTQYLSDLMCFPVFLLLFFLFLQTHQSMPRIWKNIRFCPYKIGIMIRKTKTRNPMKNTTVWMAMAVNPKTRGKIVNSKEREKLSDFFKVKVTGVFKNIEVLKWKC